MTRQKIKQVLTETIHEYATDKEIPVKYPNKIYEPTLEETWIQIFFLDSAPTNTALQEDQQQIQGIMQININVEKGIGTYASEMIMSELQELFKVNGIIRTDNGIVHLGKVYESGEEIDSAWYSTILTVEYNEFSTNT